MEILTPSIIFKPRFSSSISPFTSSLTTLSKKTPYKFRKTLLKSFPNSSFSSTLPLKTSKNSHITARFGRPTKRRNSLRKKLTGGDDLKVRENPQKVLEPVHHFVDNEIIDSNLGSTILEKDSGEVGSSQIDIENSNVENARQFEDSVLWDKLEGWVEQYKKDIEFWGIGSNPIFTVFQDINGNIDQVLVDEDEILKRSGVEPLFFREESELKAFDDVNSKIAHAKFLAKELKSGKNVFPKNSSVAKFVVSGESSGFVSRIKSILVPQMSLAKVSRVAIAVACGFVVISVIKKLFTLGGKEAEMTSFEKEMLRRKKKSRMTKEKLQRGSVEVVEEPIDPPTVLTERPFLDKEEVLNSIREAKGLNNSLVMLDVGGAQETESTVMDTKIWEIQRMARQAREIEREGSPSERDELDEKVPEEIQLEKKETFEGFEDSIWIDELENQASNAVPSTEEDATESHVVAEKYAETRIFNGSPEMETLDNLKTHSKDAIFTSEKVSEGNEDVGLHSISGETIMDDKKIHDISDSLNVAKGTHSYISGNQVNSSKKTSARRMPKIIRSVKEAREYLMQKHNKESEDGDIATTTAAKDDGVNNNYSQRLGENDEVPDSSNANREVDRVPASKVSRDHAVKRNEFLAIDTNGLKVETESGSSQNRPSDPPTSEDSGIATTLNFGKTMKIDGMLKPTDSHERSVPVASEIKFCDTSQEVTEPLISEQSLEKADKFDEIPKHTDLSEISEHVAGRNSSHYVSTSTEESGVPPDNALHDTSLLKKEDLSNDGGNDKLDETNEPPTTELSEMYVPAAVGREVNDLASEENALLPIETKDENSYEKNHVESRPQNAETFRGSGSGVEDREGMLIADKEKWLEKNFQEVEPIVKKIGSGFRNNYNVAREKTKQEKAEFNLMSLSSIVDGTELEWMQDDKLREIVFKVRENELAGRDPFHSMDPENKVAFFEGLENKVEIENQKLSVLHEWLHSNIENVDYGADGISLYDPPEKVIPQWKGPPLDKIPDFLNNSRDQQQVKSSLQKVDESTKPENAAETSPEGSTPKSAPRQKVSKSSKTVIEASDGSIKPGKRSGKEFWQHTKKWSRGFVESYNAETDPEVKSVMKDIGKDLDRWITEKEIKDSADLMDKVPQKGKEVVEKKLNKLKREMELFGPQAVVSKYREYAEVKEEDYLWWLDLPHLLCIELYTYEGEDQRVGFYSLEMAGDLEIEPKPHHVIAFEDPGDCKNFCYIIQAHLEMLGKGKAFIVPQPPKDVFWQAKANGFGVTVIRNRELKLNVDQTLEEVEELITEIGSKMYHDKIMRERSVDISSLMKGVFGVSPPSKRKRKKQARKRPSKS